MVSQPPWRVSSLLPLWLPRDKEHPLQPAFTERLAEHPKRWLLLHERMRLICSASNVFPVIDVMRHAQ